MCFMCWYRKGDRSTFIQPIAAVRGFQLQHCHQSNAKILVAFFMSFMVILYHCIPFIFSILFNYFDLISIKKSKLIVSITLQVGWHTTLSFFELTSKKYLDLKVKKYERWVFFFWPYMNVEFKMNIFHNSGNECWHTYEEEKTKQVLFLISDNCTRNK